MSGMTQLGHIDLSSTDTLRTDRSEFKLQFLHLHTGKITQFSHLDNR